MGGWKKNMVPSEGVGMNGYGWRLLIGTRNELITALAGAGGRALFWRAAGAFCSLMATMIVTRCLGPDQLGISASFMVGVVFAVVLTDLNLGSICTRYAKKGEEALPVLAGTISVLRFITGGCVVVTAVLVSWAQKVDPGLWLWVGGGMVWLGTVNNPVWFYTAERKLDRYYRGEFWQSALYLICALLLLKPGASAGEDLICKGVGALTGMFLLWKGVLDSVKKTWIGVNWTLLRRLIREGGWLIAGGMLLLAWQRIPELLLIQRGMIEELGQYRPAILMAGMLSTFIMIPVRLLYPDMVEQIDGDGCSRGRNFLRSMSLVYLKWGLMGAGVVALTVPWMYGLAFGGEYAPAAGPATVLILSQVIWAAGVPLWGGVLARGDYRFWFILISVSTVMAMGLGFFLVAELGLWGAAFLSLSKEVVVLLACLWYFRKWFNISAP